MRKIKSILLLLILLPYKTYSSDTCTEKILDEFNIHNKRATVFFIKGADCFNCYIVGKTAMLSTPQEERFLVLTDIPKRVARDFILKEFETEITEENTSFSKELWDCFNIDGTSFVLNIDGNSVKKKTLLKHYSTNAIATHFNVMTVDSLDLLNYYGGANSRVYINQTSLYVYNDIRNTIFELDANSGELLRSISTQKLNLQYDSFIDKFQDVAHWRYEYTIQFLKNNNEFAASLFQMGEPYITTSYIYVPLTVLIVDTTHNENGQVNDILYRNEVFVRLDKNFKNKQYFYFPFKTFENSDEFYNDFSHGYFLNDSIFFMLGKITSHDSIFVEMNVNTAMPNQLLNVRYPNYFPLKNANGHLNLYLTSFLQVQGKLYYYFPLEGRLYDINTNQLMLDVDIDSVNKNDITKGQINSFVFDMKVKDGFLYIVENEQRTSTYLLKYAPHNFKLLEKKKIIDGKVNKVLLGDTHIFYLYADDESAYVKKIAY